MNTDGLSDLCWRGLRRFHNVDYVRDVLVYLHNIPRGQRDNAKKQAEQIKYCLLQAREYFIAAKAVGLATSPTLLYYSVMSLALAEILLKHQGMCSLDAARGQNAHHGLEFSLQAQGSLREQTLSARGLALRARPAVRSGGERFGTFELWHQTAREMPLVGRGQQLNPNSGSTVHYNVMTLSGAMDVRLPVISGTGVSLLDCFQHLPSMADIIIRHGEKIKIAFANVKQIANFSGMWLAISVHPAQEDTLHEIYSDIKIRPNDVESVNVVEHDSGVQIFIPRSNDQKIDCAFPQAFPLSNESCAFLRSSWPLNEFGVFYVALFISGNYARYYPDKWLYEIDHNTPLVLALEEMLSAAFERVPLLALSELSRQCIVLDEPALPI